MRKALVLDTSTSNRRLSRSSSAFWVHAVSRAFGFHWRDRRSTYGGPDRQAGTGAAIEKGAEIFANNCATCHGAEVRGSPARPSTASTSSPSGCKDVGFAGTLHDYIQLTVAAGRPSKANAQWGVIMPTWSNRYGGPLRDDQVLQATAYVLNWEEDALKQTPEEDPWIPFQDTPSKAAPAAGGAAPQANTTPASPRPPEQLFTDMGCVGCHQIGQPQTDTNRGPIAPNMADLGDVAGSMVPGQDAKTYLHNSIVNPNAFIVPGYQPNVMPQNFAERMSEEEINGLVDWLLSHKMQ